eukprot:TRINITY_DN7793_c0_g1_i2.p1 TRINITY_DN7793_c0_g1~~TRINITY_DN7793_c0_g1_i2.p1  ORF type:complete len:355 (-),score=78.81 TRINITY_DN7793_c0_g1_i2:31-1095(-)
MSLALPWRTSLQIVALVVLLLPSGKLASGATPDLPAHAGNEDRTQRMAREKELEMGLANLASSLNLGASSIGQVAPEVALPRSVGPVAAIAPGAVLPEKTALEEHIVCLAPTSVDGYAVTEHQMRLPLNVTATCLKGFTGHAEVTPCTKAGEHYRLSGCSRIDPQGKCQRPQGDTVAGYVISEKDLNLQSFSIHAACAPGFEGMAQVSPCEKDGTSYKLVGCEKKAGKELSFSGTLLGSKVKEEGQNILRQEKAREDLLQHDLDVLEKALLQRYSPAQKTPATAASTASRRMLGSQTIIFCIMLCAIAALLWMYPRRHKYFKPAWLQRDLEAVPLFSVVQQGRTAYGSDPDDLL